MIDVILAIELTQFYYSIVACIYGTLEYIKSLHQAFQKIKDPLFKKLNTATFYNRPKIAKYCIGTET